MRRPRKSPPGGCLRRAHKGFWHIGGLRFPPYSPLITGGEIASLFERLQRTRYVALGEIESELFEKYGRNTRPLTLESMTEPTTEETLDSILGGALRLYQPRRGYRFSVESVLLARFAATRPAASVLELGAGCGVVALTFAALARPREVVALEIQAGLAALTARNAALNGLTMVRAVCADLRSRRALDAPAGGFDLVLANPPFRARHSGRESPLAGRRLARGEAAARLEDFVAAAARYTRHGGRVAFVFAAARGAELISALRARRLEPKRIRFIHPYAAASASTMLVEARKGGGIEVEIEPALVMHDAPGVYSDEARALLERL